MMVTTALVPPQRMIKKEQTGSEDGLRESCATGPPLVGPPGDEDRQKSQIMTRRYRTRRPHHRTRLFTYWSPRGASPVGRSDWTPDDYLYENQQPVLAAGRVSVWPMEDGPPLGVRLEFSRYKPALVG